jgi:hypothetical protein
VELTANSQERIIHAARPVAVSAPHKSHVKGGKALAELDNESMQAAESLSGISSRVEIEWQGTVDEAVVNGDFGMRGLRICIAWSFDRLANRAQRSEE